MACKCFCISCKEPLVAYNNPTNKNKSHFKHVANSDCRNYYETLIHYQAKEIIDKTKSITVLDIEYYLSADLQNYRKGFSIRKNKKLKKIKIDEVILEQKYKSIIPDITCHINSKKLFIEIAVTHFVNEEKLNKINNLKVPTLEIDLSNVERNTEINVLEKILNGGIYRQKWIFNEKINHKKKLVEKNKETVIKYISDNIKEIKAYGKTKKIYNCPKRKLERNQSITFQDSCEECFSFLDYEPGFYNIREPSEKQNSYVRCLGHKEKEFEELIISLNKR